MLSSSIFLFESSKYLLGSSIFVCSLSQIDFLFEPKENMLGLSKYLVDS